MTRLAIAVALLPWMLPIESGHDAPAAGAHVVPRLIGAWEGEGELFGNPATFSMAWAWELDGKFVRLTFDNGVIEAIAHYRINRDSERLDGTWFDSRGEVVELRATVTDSTLVTRWIARTEQGRTTYRVVDDETVEVRDDVLGEDGWRTFGRATYRRAE